MSQPPLIILLGCQFFKMHMPLFLEILCSKGRMMVGGLCMHQLLLPLRRWLPVRMPANPDTTNTASGDVQLVRNSSMVLGGARGGDEVPVQPFPGRRDTTLRDHLFLLKVQCSSGRCQEERRGDGRWCCCGTDGCGILQTDGYLVRRRAVSAMKHRHW